MIYYKLLKQFVKLASPPQPVRSVDEEADTHGHGHGGADEGQGHHQKGEQSVLLVKSWYIHIC